MTERQKKVANLREYHESYFDAIEESNAYFDSKAYKTIGGEQYIGFFESQLGRGTPIYFEINDFKQNIIDKNRTLYKITPDENFKTLKTTYKYDPNTPAGEQYYINKTSSKIEEINRAEFFRKSNRIEIPLEDIVKDDCNYNELTARDYACIHLRTPQSNKQWLNDLIIKHGS